MPINLPFIEQFSYRCAATNRKNCHCEEHSEAIVNRHDCRCNHAIAYATWQSPGTNYRFLPRLNRDNCLIWLILTTFPKNHLCSGRLPRPLRGLAMTAFFGRQFLYRNSPINGNWQCQCAKRPTKKVGLPLFSKALRRRGWHRRS